MVFLCVSADRLMEVDSLASNIIMGAIIKLYYEQTNFAVLPAFHCFGMMAEVMPVLANGCANLYSETEYGEAGKLGDYYPYSRPDLLL